jgi:hypothetical protein
MMLGAGGCDTMMDLPGMMLPPVEPTDPIDPQDYPLDRPMLPDDHACAGEPEHVGPTPVRLMTRVEYNNVVRDLLDDDTRPADAFPIENETLGFENGEAHAANPLLVEAYMDAAEAVAQRAVDHLGMPALVPCPPGIGDPLECGEAFIQDFGTKAFRRPLTFDEYTLFQQLYLTTLNQWGMDEAIRLVMQAMLQSPQFLYRIEFGHPDDFAEAVPLTSYELASRLSFFLWNSAPDATLLAAAEQDLLQDPMEIERQARRMLEDERAKAVVWDFFRQWLDLDRLDGITKDADANPLYTPDLRQAYKDEARAFIEYAAYEDGLLETVLTSNKAFVNDDLARVYGLEAPGTDALVEAQADPAERSGLMTLPGVMALLSLPDQSSPILRGVFVREELLCQPLQPPPPDVVVVPPDPDPNATTRERFAQHTEDPACQGCHLLIDPLGFGFERYDAIGQYRAEENGLPVDPSGSLMFTGETAFDGDYEGAPELMSRFAEMDTVRDCMASHWFRYGLGRIERDDDDSCNLGYPREVFADSGGDFRELMVAMTQTWAFRYRLNPQREAQLDGLPEGP